MANEHVAKLLAVAGAQHGVLGLDQALRAGVSRDQVRGLVRSGVLERCDVGVLRVVGIGRSWEQDLQVGVLRAGADAVVSHRAAAVLWEIEGVDRAPVELSVPRGHRRRPRVGLVHEVRDLERRDTTSRRGMRVTNPARTVVDLAARLRGLQLEIALDDLLRRRLTDLRRVEGVARRLAAPGRSGPRAVLDLLDDRATVAGLTDTGFETRLLRILREAGLPAPTPQHVLRDGRGAFVARFDAAYVEAKVGIEADSERWHMDRRRFVEDRTRRAVAESLGWRVLAFTNHHLTRQQRFVADTVARTLAVAGAA